MLPSRSHSTARRRFRPLHLETLEGRVVPAVITVLNTDDAGVGSLRAAIEAANLDPAQDTIAFAPEVTGTITLLSALPVLSSDITMAGPRASALTVARTAAAGAPAFRILELAAGVDVNVSGLTLSGGEQVGNFGGEQGQGGGIYNAVTRRHLQHGDDVDRQFDRRP